MGDALIRMPPARLDRREAHDFAKGEFGQLPETALMAAPAVELHELGRALGRGGIGGMVLHREILAVGRSDAPFRQM